MVNLLNRIVKYVVTKGMVTHNVFTIETVIMILLSHKKNGRFHPYKCGTDICRASLVPAYDNEGYFWYCEHCEYKQRISKEETNEIVHLWYGENIATKIFQKKYKGE